MAPWVLAAIGAAVLAILVISVLRSTGLRAHRTRQALEPPAPPSPVPGARLQRAVSPREVTAVRAPAVRLLLRDVVVEAEIEHAGGAFRLRPVGASKALRLDEDLVRMPVEPYGVPSRKAPASRAHALLCDRLVQDGWEPCGRGATWYAHRYRRTLEVPT
jgi:hypothetical protein